MSTTENTKIRICSICGSEKTRHKGKDGWWRWDCRVCGKRRSTDWAKANPEKRREISLKWAKANPEKQLQSSLNWIKNNPDKVKENYLKRRYGISLEEYQKMYDAQGGLCAICNDPYDILCVDHCHKTGTVRGLLCDACNHGLGRFKDEPNLLSRAIDYLETYANPSS